MTLKIQLAALIFFMTMSACNQPKNSNTQAVPSDDSISSIVGGKQQSVLAFVIYDNHNLELFHKQSKPVVISKKIEINEPIKDDKGKEVQRLTAKIELSLYISVSEKSGSILDSARLLFLEGSKEWIFKGELSSEQINMGTEEKVLGSSECVVFAELSRPTKYLMKSKQYYFDANGKITDLDSPEVTKKIFHAIQ